MPSQDFSTAPAKSKHPSVRATCPPLPSPAWPTQVLAAPAGRWMRQAICYFDRYAKRDGQWLFVSRAHQLFYGADHDQRPNDLPPANWPENDTGTGTLPFGWPTWAAREGG